MSIHKEQSPIAGQTVKVKDSVQEIGGEQFRVEDWLDRVIGQSWMNANGNFACMKYAVRSGFSGLPTDNEVVYGKVGHLGHCVHVSELEI